MVMQKKHQYANCGGTNEDIFYHRYLHNCNFSIMGEYYFVMRNLFFNMKERNMLKTTKYQSFILLIILQGVILVNSIVPRTKAN